MRSTASTGIFEQPDGLVGGDLADRDVGIEEGGVGRGDHDVGVGDEVQPAAGADAVDRGDDRLRDPVVPGREAQLGPFGAARLLPQGVGVARQLDDVQAGLERRAGAGVDDHADRGVGVELPPCRLELVRSSSRPWRCRPRDG